MGFWQEWIQRRRAKLLCKSSPPFTWYSCNCRSWCVRASSRPELSLNLWSRTWLCLCLINTGIRLWCLRSNLPGSIHSLWSSKPRSRSLTECRFLLLGLSSWMLTDYRWCRCYRYVHQWWKPVRYLNRNHDYLWRKRYHNTCWPYLGSRNPVRFCKRYVRHFLPTVPLHPHNCYEQHQNRWDWRWRRYNILGWLGRRIYIITNCPDQPWSCMHRCFNNKTWDHIDRGRWFSYHRPWLDNNQWLTKRFRANCFKVRIRDIQW